MYALTVSETKPYYPEPDDTVCCLRCGGACAWICLGLTLFTLILSAIPISGISDAPSYARNLVYMSVAHHFEDVQQHIYDVSPPPPQF